MKSSVYKYLVLFLVLFGGCTTDLHTKHWAADTFKNKPPTMFIDGYIDMCYAENDAMVFSLFKNTDPAIRRPLSILSSLAANCILIAVIWYYRSKALLFLLPFFIVLSGGLGNLSDKLRYGYVVDFIHFHVRNAFDWPYIFNVADIFLCVGMGIIVIHMLCTGKKDGTDTTNNGTQPDFHANDMQ